MNRSSAVLLALAGLLGGSLLLASDPQTNKTPEKQFLYKVQANRVEMLRGAPTAEEASILEEHFNYLKDLTDKGVVILAGRTLNTDETSFGIVIFRAESEQAAREIMNNDPAVKKGVMRATLFPYRVALMEGRSPR